MKPSEFSQVLMECAMEDSEEGHTYDRASESFPS